jgi:hypothetical protein
MMCASLLAGYLGSAVLCHSSAAVRLVQATIQQVR